MADILTCFALILASNGGGPTTVLSGYPTHEAAQKAADQAEPPSRPYFPCSNGTLCVATPLTMNNFRDIRIIPAPLKDCR